MRGRKLRKDSLCRGKVEKKQRDNNAKGSSGEGEESDGASGDRCCTLPTPRARYLLIAPLSTPPQLSSLIACLQTQTIPPSLSLYCTVTGPCLFHTLWIEEEEEGIEGDLSITPHQWVERMWETAYLDN